MKDGMLRVAFSAEDLIRLKALAQAQIRGDEVEYQRIKELIGDMALWACAIAANE
jgi:hypothetical protein